MKNVKMSTIQTVLDNLAKDLAELLVDARRGEDKLAEEATLWHMAALRNFADALNAQIAVEESNESALQKEARDEAH